MGYRTIIVKVNAIPEPMRAAESDPHRICRLAIA
jgi:hypothetical protein